jgi:hypothetical protein
VAALTDLSPGICRVGVSVFGGCFASYPAALTAGLNLPLDLVEMGTAVPGSAFCIDADSAHGQCAVWDRGMARRAT